jgi:hypothetical protein
VATSGDSGGLLVLVDAASGSLRPLIVDGAAVIFPSPADFVRYTRTQPLPASAQVVPCLKRRQLLGFLRRAKEAGATFVLIAAASGERGDLDAQIDRLANMARPVAPSAVAVPPLPEPSPEPVVEQHAEASALLDQGFAQIAILKKGGEEAAPAIRSLKALLATISTQMARGARELMGVRARLAEEMAGAADRRPTAPMLELLAETKEPRVVECLARHLDVRDDSLVCPRPALRAIFTFGRAAVPPLLRHCAVEDSGLRMEVLADALLTIAGGAEAGVAVREAIDREKDPRRRDRLKNLQLRMQTAYGN